MTLQFKLSEKWLLLVPFIVFTTSLVLLLLPVLPAKNQSLFYKALSIDLALTLPLSYLIVSGKAKVPKLFAVPLLIIGVVVASILVPADFHTPLNFIKTWLIPVVELSVISFIVYKVYTLRKTYQKGEKGEFYNDVLKASASVFPKKVAHVLSFEIAVFYYAFTFSKAQSLNVNEFSTYKDSGIKAILGALILAILAETVGLHFLISKWSLAAAWALSILSVYTGIQVLAIIRSLTYKPIILGKNELVLHFGILNKVKIPYELIHKFYEMNDDEIQAFNGTKASLFYQNIAFELSSEVISRGFYGITKKAKSISIFIDNPKDFIKNLNSKLKTVNTQSENLKA
ncbi:MAG: hypothetical protein JXQ87_12385 [Bacteroidia bacterium]